MHPNLSFEQAPPISVPYRFFLTAPWFGVAAGLVLAWAGDGALASRWTTGTLALTHLLVVGFMLQAMAGALLQFVPVAAGGNVWRPRLVAAVVHPGLAIAAILLVAAFAGMGGSMFRLAAVLFACTAGFYLVVVGRAVFRTSARSGTIRALRAAVVGLGVTVVLGISLAEGVGGARGWPLLEIANVHAAWGLGGWALMLLSGVSYLVVPMFQLTPAYPGWFSRALPPALLLVLAVWSLQLGGASPAWQRATWFAGLLLAAAFAVVTLSLQYRRRRKLADPTLWFFRAAMISLIAILASAIAIALVPTLDAEPRATVWLGVLALPGVFVSAINGMLYRIVPFLNWLHLQRLMSGLSQLPPNIKQMLPERAMIGQMRLHFLAVGLLLAAVVWPELARVAGMAFAASCAWLAWNLIGAARVYGDFRDRIRAGGAGRAP